LRFKKPSAGGAPADQDTDAIQALASDGIQDWRAGGAAGLAPVRAAELVADLVRKAVVASCGVAAVGHQLQCLLGERGWVSAKHRKQHRNVGHRPVGLQHLDAYSASGHLFWADRRPRGRDELALLDFQRHADLALERLVAGNTLSRRNQRWSQACVCTDGVHS